MTRSSVSWRSLAEPADRYWETRSDLPWTWAVTPGAPGSGREYGWPGIPRWGLLPMRSATPAPSLQRSKQGMSDRNRRC